ncbi:hypothetical protein [Azospirillum picis]|uniref:LysM domain-containing protein n=1 Tax=Azospirillum picis TaxID=488438 RepID=A0ABU0MT86_9PROT|nr:hypothetical protein [Azospirillum picis]MBP2302799.1 hypothetical protein [Azospirillum picis]MDQ0536539.1 hypothetical protein [Azospirillum picis]
MDPIEAFLQSSALTPPAFAPTSRYYGLPTVRSTLPDGRTVVFVTRRFLPPVANFSVIETVTAVAEERLDNLAARHLGEAEQWWRIADANGAMLPEAVVAEPGATVYITLPEGVPGAADAR